MGFSVGTCPPEDVAEAAQLVRRSLTACSLQVAQAALMELRVSTKARAESAEDLATIAQIYVELMLEYPPDVAVDAARYWARNEKFWPALAELKTELDTRVRKRRLLLEALERAVSPQARER